MGIEKWLGYGLCYGILALLFLHMFWKVRFSREEALAFRQNILQLIKLNRENSKEFSDSCNKALIALAMQKSMILIQDADGDWKLVALDTASKDAITEFFRRVKEPEGKNDENRQASE